jgi:hypothetical protein
MVQLNDGHPGLAHPNAGQIADLSSNRLVSHQLQCLHPPNLETSSIAPISTPSTKGVFVYSFSIIFFISFREIQKLDDPKSEKLKAPFHEFLSFSLSGLSNFWISRKLIYKNDEKLKQTPYKLHQLQRLHPPNLASA